jgi:phenylpropionate dioxygenase-like ring-hydroxylating dioxygenase large terminal subunit
MDSSFELDRLVGPGWVDGSIYTDPVIFDREMERIFRTTWVYVAHDSEVAVPGDYQTRTIAGEPLIVSRDEDGQVHVFLNRCTHRGNSVCQHAAGNSQFFRCRYHGWTFSNKGDLVGVPYDQRYGDDFEPAALGLTEVPRMAVHRGFIFVSLSADAPPLADHLRGAAEMIDLFVDQSPAGTIRLDAGVQRAEYRGNWKFVGMDGYHSSFVHKSIAMLQGKQDPARAKEHGETDPDSNLAVRKLGNPDKVGNRTWDYGNGHVRLDSSPQRLPKVESILNQLRATAHGREYLERMERRHGPDEAHRLICISEPHISIFPNMQLVGYHVRVIEPLAADRTVINGYPAMLDGVPDEINVERLRRHEWFFSSAGFGTPDDYEIFERNQLGLAADLNPRVLLARGHGEETEVDGVIEGSYSDEVPQRGQITRWSELMAAEAGR